MGLIDYALTQLPELKQENLDRIMFERIAETQNDETVIPMLWQGFLELPIFVSGCKRSAKYYIPRNTPQGAPLVIMNIPAGETAIAFLQKSGWAMKAEKDGFCLFMIEPEPDGWKSLEEEESYIFEAVNTAKTGQYCMTAFASYIVAYGEIGVGLHKAVMADPLHIAAAVFMDAGGVDEAFLNEYREKHYQVSDPFNPNGEGLDIAYRDIPVPVWIAADKGEKCTQDMISYWKDSAKAGKIKQDPDYGIIYMQSADTEYTPEGNILKVAASNHSYDYCSEDTTELIYGFLKQYYRYGMGPLSNMVSRRIDFKAAGIERHSFTDSNGIYREYLVYIPKQYRDGSRKLPTIIAYHGASQSMRNMMSNGLWYEIADREGLIIVCPESTLEPMPLELSGGTVFAYRPLWALNDPDKKNTEIVYASELLDLVIAKFPVDESKIYCNGHSMGCMMTNFLGSSTVSHRFAAVGATSGCLKAKATGGCQKLPAFMTIGQYDLWSYLLSDEGPVADEIDMWLMHNGLATERNVRDVRINGVTENYREGRYHHYVWKDADGIPWVRYAWISQKHHVHTPDENATFWYQWFSKWHIDEEGNHCYHN